MQIRAFTGGDYAPASRLLGSLRHAEEGSRSYWFGAEELCGLLAKSDHGIVVERDAETLAGIVLLTSGRASDANPDMRAHWLQQRTLISTVCRSLGMRPGAEGADPDGGGEVSASELFGPGAAEHVLLFLVDPELPDDMVQALRHKASAWLAEHDVEVDDDPSADLPILPSSDADNDVAFALIDGHASQAGLEFRSYNYHIMDGTAIAAGIVAWAVGSELHIDTLAVDEGHRRQGLGGRLLAYVEKQAADGGCTVASVDTFSFQAPDYYPAHGYEVTFRRQLDGGMEHIYFSKRL